MLERAGRLGAPEAEAPRPPDARDGARLEEGRGDRRAWRQDRAVRGRLTMPLPITDHLPRPARDDALDVRGDHDRSAAQGAHRAPGPQRRAQRARQATVRHQGSGHKRLYRVIDWKREKYGVPTRFATVEYDPNRSARIGLLHYADGDKRYMLLPHGLGVGDTVGFRPGRRGPHGQCAAAVAHPARHAGAQRRAHRRSRRPDRAQCRLGAPSCWPRRATTRRCGCRRARFAACGIECMATVGQVSNLDHENQSSARPGGRAISGVARQVRGSAMTPRDHPHGGGEGKAPTGMPPKPRGASPPWACAPGSGRTSPTS